jgi:hypothetical protein
MTIFKILVHGLKISHAPTNVISTNIGKHWPRATFISKVGKSNFATVTEQV